MKKNWIKWAAIFFIYFTPVFMNAAKIGVLHLKVVGVEVNTAEVFVSLFVGELTNSGYTVLDPDAMDTAVAEVLRCYEARCAAEAGFKAKVEQVVYGSISKLGEKHIVQLSVVNVAAQEVIWSGSLSATTAEDLDLVAKRLAKSIYEGKKPEETIEVGMITEEEEKEPRRRRVFHTAGTKAGVIIPMGGYADASYLYHVGSLYWYETSKITVEIGAYYAWSGDLGYTLEGSAWEACAPELSILYLFNKGDVCPYAGGGVGFGLIGVNPENYTFGTGMGVSLNGGLGVVFLRTYDIRIILDARYRFNLAQATEIFGDERFEGPHHGFMFSIGFTYMPKFGGCGFGCL